MLLYYKSKMPNHDEIINFADTIYINIRRYLVRYFIHVNTSTLIAYQKYSKLQYWQDKIIIKIIS